MLSKFFKAINPLRELSPAEIIESQRKASELAVAKLSLELVFVQHMLDYHKAQLKNLEIMSK